ncbi:MAG: hypothetical protein CMJ32_07770 [Phycisphaerae bacterium]|nr:hypothetical protein [Phycisphaerae bacterium]
MGHFMLTARPLVASSGTTTVAPSDILLEQLIPWLGLLLLVVIVGGAFVLMIRRTTKSQGPGQGGFTLEDIRQLHRSGELSDEEFQKAREALIQQARSHDGESDQPPA